MTALDAEPSTRRTLFLDLGFFAGSGLGALVSYLYFLQSSTGLSLPFMGTSMLIGSVGGWLLTYLLTDGMQGPRAASTDATVRLGISPTRGGASLTLGGRF